MFKKFLISILMLFIMNIFAMASEGKNLPYKNIKDGTKIAYIDGTWTTKFNKKNIEYFVKKDLDFYNREGVPEFSVDYDYMFLDNGHLTGFSNSSLKFYDLSCDENKLNQRELLPDEVQELFKGYRVIKISDFSIRTNSLKIKKGFRDLKLLLLNDTDKDFSDYSFTSGNAQFEKYELNGFVNITKKGMVQFSKSGENSATSPWFVILVR